MANPRQRRKQRSSTHKKVRHSNHAKKNLRKMPPLRAPKVLQEAWNPHLTVKQNYTALGLLATLNPRAKGGTEIELANNVTNSHQPPQEQHAVEPVTSEKLPIGYGRIIRDDNGNIIDVVLNEDPTPQGDGSNLDMDFSAPEPINTFPTNVSSGSSKLIQELETLSSQTTRKKRFLSIGEREWLDSLIKVYGDDIDAAARDRKRNPWQKTASEIKRMIQRANTAT